MSAAKENLTLVAAIVGGDRESAEAFTQKFRPRLVYLARKKGIPACDCEDVAQETLIAALDQLRRGLFRGESSPGTWVLRILSGKMVDYWRSQPSAGLIPLHDRKLETATDYFFDIPGPTNDPALRIMVDEILRMLPVRYRGILLLKVRDGYKIEEISQLVGWPPGTVGRVLAEARNEFVRLWRKWQASDSTK